MSQNPPKIILLSRDNYLVAVKNSVGSHMFRNLYAEVDGVRKDIVEGGELSCALFVSSLLKIFDLIGGVHSTVSGTEADILHSGWEKTTEPTPGDILVWEAQKEGEDSHAHIGFFVGDNKAVSNSFKERMIAEHDWTYDGQRKITAIYRLIQK